MNKNLILLGCGGHAKVLTDILRHNGTPPNILAAPKKTDLCSIFSGMKQLSSDRDILNFSPDETLLVNGLGSLPGNNRRTDIFLEFNTLGYHFIPVLSPHAYISEYADIGPGVQVMPTAVVQAGAQIGQGTIINTGAIIEHDCIIGENNHIAPGTTLSGGVITGNNVHIGTGANIIQSIKIIDNSIIGAGCTITRDVTTSSILYPPKPYQKGNKYE